MDTGGLIEVPGFVVATDIFVVAKTGIDRGVQTVKLFCHAFFTKRTDAVVDDVASDKDQVGMFCVDEVYPTAECCTTVVVT